MTGTLSIESAILCTLVSLALGMVIAVSYMAQGTFTKNFIITLVLLPALVQTVIMIVNGNLGTSVAVMGAFSLVRFRSTPGSAREISGIFFAMVIGLATGMGYLTYAVLITVIVGLVMFILTKSKFAESKTVTKDLKVTIPENLDYTDIFDDIFSKFTKSSILNKVKTTNLGSMYELQYSVEMLDESQEKQFIDELRCRNGNLTIICGRPVISREEL
jgi:type IV secretory pathway VirB2 component (pilin)